eukprot:3116147-Rhodomonas_salina.2
MEGNRLVFHFAVCAFRVSATASTRGLPGTDAGYAATRMGLGRRSDAHPGTKLPGLRYLPTRLLPDVPYYAFARGYHCICVYSVEKMDFEDVRESPAGTALTRDASRPMNQRRILWYRDFNFPTVTVAAMATPLWACYTISGADRG